MPDIINRWMCSFLPHRRQRAKICDIMSDSLQIAGGMPQGSYLVLLPFVVLTDALRPTDL